MGLPDCGRIILPSRLDTRHWRVVRRLVTQRKIMKTKDTTTKFVTMRLPIEVYEKVKAQAKAESRSVSGHIAYLLKKQLG
jgi:hypothetical protein